MRNLFFLSASLFIAVFGEAQVKMDKIPESLNKEVLQKAGIYMSRLGEFKEWLAKKNEESARTSSSDHVLFRWPMRVNSNYDDIPGYYILSNYMDLARDYHGFPKDWYCAQVGMLNYDGHEGNDYSLYPFFWRMMNNDNVVACAAAPGIVIGARDDLNNSDNCQRDSLESNEPNFVAILHSDSSITRYLHLKTGSVRVSEQQFVEEGQILGNIASSGNSSNPHLHFDLRHFRDTDSSYNFIEPFDRATDTAYGTGCNSFTNTSWWKNQKTYINPQMNRVATHSGLPVLQGYVNSTYSYDFCPEFEDPKLKNQFSPNQVLIAGVALTHVSRKDSVYITISYPNGNPWISAAMPVPNLIEEPVSGWARQMYLTKNFILPSNAPTGTYTIKAEFTYLPFDASHPFYPETTPVTTTTKHFFTVGCVTSETLSGNVNGEFGHIVSNDINSTQLIQSGKMRYQSANYIQLNPGFTAVQGSTFKARIRSCDFCD